MAPVWIQPSFVSQFLQDVTSRASRADADGGTADVYVGHLIHNGEKIKVRYREISNIKPTDSVLLPLLGRYKNNSRSALRKQEKRSAGIL